MKNELCRTPRIEPWDIEFELERHMDGPSFVVARVRDDEIGRMTLRSETIEVDAFVFFKWCQEVCRGKIRPGQPVLAKRTPAATSLDMDSYDTEGYALKYNSLSAPLFKR
jgi:hypothetical protein